MSYHEHQAALVARTILALNRPLEANQLTARAVDMLRDHFLRAWYDPAHRFEAGDKIACRAVDDLGRFCWLVRSEARALALSHAANPYDAIAETNEPPAPPSNMRGDDLHQLARALRRGEIRFHLVADDFAGTTGVCGLLGRCGLPGRLAGWMIAVLPGLGTALWAANHRTRGSRRAGFAGCLAA